MKKKSKLKNVFRIDVNVSTVGTVCFGLAIILGSITESLGSFINNTLWLEKFIFKIDIYFD